MLINFAVLAVLLILLGVCIWLFTRAGRARTSAGRTIGRIVTGLAVLGFAVLGGLYARGLYTYYRHNTLAEVSLPVTSVADMPASTRSEMVTRGQHLAQSLCAACHTTNGQLPLSGGINMSDDVGMPMGDLFAPNITPGGRLSEITDADIWRMFRTGVKANGQYPVMPIAAMSHLSDDDLQAVIAYLRSQPSISQQTLPINPSPLMMLTVGANLFNLRIDPVTQAVTAPPKAATAEYGNYIVNYADCRACHGANLDGNVNPPLPSGPNLRVVKGWTAEQFITALRTGVDPGGETIDPPMPWRSYGQMDDVELTAVWAYLHSLD